MTSTDDRSPDVADVHTVSGQPHGVGAHGAATTEAVCGLPLPGTASAVVPVPESEVPPPPLWGHQERALAWVDERANSYIAGWMGTGKSRVVVEWLNRNASPRVLILCPLRVIGSWERQFNLYGRNARTIVPLDDGTTTARAQRLVRALAGKNDTTVALLNYEAILRPALRRELLRAPWDLLVLDEAHKLKAPGGACSRTVASIRARKRIALSGTPVPHSPLDLYGQFRALDKSVFGSSFVAFRSRYAVMGGYQMHQVVGFRSLDEMERKAGTLMLTLPKELLTLPPVVETTLPVELGSTARAHYAQMKALFRTEIAEGRVTAANALVKLLRLQQITSGYMQVDEGPLVEVDSAKRDTLVEFFSDLDKNERTVVFCRFRCDLSSIQMAALESGRRCFEFSGAADQREDWKRTDGAVLATQIQAGGVGIDDLAAHACYAVYFSLGFSFSDYIQSHERLHRPGQTKATRFIHLIARNTIDDAIMRAIGKRQDLVKEVVDGIAAESALCRTP